MTDTHPLRKIRSVPLLHVSVSLLALQVAGCSGGVVPPAGAAAGSNAGHRSISLKEPTVFDAGDISLAGGPRRISHVFEVTNSSDRPVDLTVRTSCGSLYGRLGKSSLLPGETTHLEVALVVRPTGLVSESAWVVHPDDHAQQFVLTANGIVAHRLRVFLIRPTVDRQGTLPLRVYLIDDDAGGEDGPPTVVSPDQVRVKRSDWITLEARDERGRRPTRQIGNVVLDFSMYAGEFPVTVWLRTPSGLTLSVVVSGKEE